jgi:hypothetical protein
MYLSKVADFIEFLSVKEHKLEEILRQIVVSAFSNLNGTSAFISELQGGNQVKIIASFAISQESKNLYESTYSLDSKIPMTDSLRDRRTVWIPHLQHHHTIQMKEASSAFLLKNMVLQWLHLAYFPH